MAEAFTNYTPFYSYLLLIPARFDWLGQPLSLVKTISAVFELSCAIVAWLGFTVLTEGLLSYLMLAGSGWNMSPAYLIATGFATAMTVRLLKESQRASASS
ncbi:hypothetical protein [Bradyrhizobium canariense]|uniref:hypothetical protein n=1 Tax=Bradyrhizobium canariense TaxID=255045 RepID=UPI001FCCC580|nr:hypothetical protein [Bradyrhizobium canariense]